MSRLKDILDIVTSSGEEADSLLADLLKPEYMTREEAQETFETCIGYDPTSYYDKKDIVMHIDTVIEAENTPEDVVQTIVEEKDEIANVAYKNFDISRQDFLAACANAAIEEVTGYDVDVVVDIDDDDSSDEEDED